MIIQGDRYDGIAKFHGGMDHEIHAVATEAVMDSVSPSDGQYVDSQNGFVSNPLTTDSNAAAAVNIGNITMEINLIPEQRTPRKRSRLTPLYHTQKHILKLKLNSDSISPRKASSSSVQVREENHDQNQRTNFELNNSNSGKHKVPTICIDSSMLEEEDVRISSSKQLGHVQKRLKDLKNAAFINDWIEILESTKEEHIRGAAAPSSGNIYKHKNVKSAEIFTLTSNERGNRMANIDLGRFFDKPESVLRDFDHIRALNRAHRTQSEQVWQGGDENAESVISNSQAKKAVLSSPREDRKMKQNQKQEYENRRYYLSRNRPQENELTDLLAVQRIENQLAQGHTQGILKSRNANRVNDPYVVLHDQTNQESSTHANTDKFSSKRPIKIQFSHDTKQTENRTTKPMLPSIPLKKGDKDTRSTEQEGPSALELIDQHMQSLLMQIESNPVRGKDENQGGKPKRVQKLKRKVMLSPIKRIVINNFPDLCIKGEGVFDNLSEAEWKYEIEGLIKSVMQNRGRLINFISLCIFL